MNYSADLNLPFGDVTCELYQVLKDEKNESERKYFSFICIINKMYVFMK